MIPSVKLLPLPYVEAIDFRPELQLFYDGLLIENGRNSGYSSKYSGYHPGPNEIINMFQLPNSGSYAISVTDELDDLTIGNYRLTLRRAYDAGHLSSGQLAQEVIEHRYQEHVWSLRGSKEDDVIIEVKSEFAHPTIELRATDGSRISFEECPSDDSNRYAECHKYQLPDSGNYYVVVRGPDTWDSTGAYEILVQ